MNIFKTSLSFGLSAIVLAACAGGGGATWTYAPLGPSQAPSGSPAASPGTSPATSPGGSPAASPGGSPAGSPAASAGTAIEVATPPDQSLAFVPNMLNAPAATLVTVNYNNNSNLPHNINFFNGPDNSAPSLGSTEIVTGPNAPRSVTFTTPDQPGDYYFWCDVHLQSMAGTLHVE